MNIRTIKSYLRDTRYCIGFLEDYKFLGSFSYKNINWLNLNGYQDGWFADPFILNVDQQRITVLAEEWFYPINHGRISKLIIARKDFRLIEVKPLLQLETHLSFPYLFKENGTLYICPENQESKSVIIYEYDIAKDTLINPLKLVDKPLMDVQIFFEGGLYYLMGVEYLTGEQVDTRTIQIFISNNLLGPYILNQTINSEYCDKRGAGLIFKFNDKIIRPSQCCENNEYGTAVIFNELQIVDTSVSEHEIGRITRNKYKNNGLVLHTYNQVGNITAIDGWDYKHRYIGRFVEYIRKNIRKYIHR